MTLLDRFRTSTARQKHPDPAVRLASVAEIPLADREAISAVAREDEDPRVRRAAVEKLLDPAVLGSLAREDGDEGVRAAADAMLRDIALEAFEGLTEADSVAAVDAIPEGKGLTQIARDARRDAVALRAVQRVRDVHALGSLARHAVSDPARVAAFEALRDTGDHPELLAVAMNSEFKDTALLALSLVTTTEELEQVAQRAKNKTAAKRARGILRDAEATSSREEPMPEPPDVEPPAPRSPDSITESHDMIEAATDLPTAMDAPVMADPIEAPPVEMPPSEPDETSRLDRERRLTRLAELAAEAAAASTDADVFAAERAVKRARREWQDVSTGLEVDAELLVKLAEAEARIASRVGEAKAADERTRRDGLARLRRLIARVEPLAAAPDLVRRNAERALREVRSALGSLPPLPTRQDTDEVTTRLKAASAALTLRLRELREAEEWKRWANVTRQEQLCARMEALAAKEDPEEIGREVRELQQEWRLVADVPRERADALWQRFKAAHDVVWPRCEAFFAADATRRAENLEKKTALCERAEALADSTAWIETAEALKGLQSDWKTIGPVSRGHEKAIWERFRAACDRFFTRRHDDLAIRKKSWAENLAKKTALCERAEALAESTDWDQAATEVKRLQAEWKTVGPVKKTRSDAIWQRFHGACDRFFARHAARHDVQRAERVAAREAICAELEALPAADGDAPANLAATLRTMRSRWQQEVAARGVDPDRARALEERFHTAFAAAVARWPAALAGTEFDPDANRKRLETIVRKIEELYESLSGPAAAVSEASPAERLAAMLKEALAANTIGGKVDEHSRWREAADEVRKAQSAWSRIGAIPDDAGRELSQRFDRVARAILEKAGETGGPGEAGRQGPGRGARSDRPRQGR